MTDYYLCNANTALVHCKGLEYRRVYTTSSKVYQQWQANDIVLLRNLTAEMSTMLALCDPGYRKIKNKDINDLPSVKNTYWGRFDE